MPGHTVAIGALVTAGAALLPDVDHHNSTIAHSGGAVTRAVAGVAERAAGGHRHGLHSLLAIAGFYFGATYLGSWRHEVPVLGDVPAGSALMFLALVAFALKALKLSKGGIARLWLTALAGTVAILYFAPDQLEWLPTSILLGVIVHLVGDFLTVGGLPLLWPWIPKPPRALDSVPVLRSIWQSNGYVAIPVLGKTGSAREWLLCSALTLYVLVAIAGAVSSIAGANLPLPGA